MKRLDPTRHRIPPIPAEGRDTLRLEAAQQFASELNAFWRSHGYPHAHHWVETKQVRNGRASVAVIRSNLVNGIPPSRPTATPLSLVRSAA